MNAVLKKKIEKIAAKKKAEGKTRPTEIVPASEHFFNTVEGTEQKAGHRNFVQISEYKGNKYLSIGKQYTTREEPGDWKFGKAVGFPIEKHFQENIRQLLMGIIMVAASEGVEIDPRQLIDEMRVNKMLP